MASTSKETKVCTGCGETKARTEYHRDATKKDGHLPRCKSCKAVTDRAYRADDHAVALLKSCRSPGKSPHRRGLVIDIDLEWCRERLAPKPRCELTGWRINYEPRKRGGAGMNPYAPSFDRIDNSIGYTPDNIRVVCAFVNMMMQSYSDEDMTPVIEALRKDAHV